MFNISITVHFPIIKHKYRISILILMKTERRSILFYIWATNIYLLYKFLKGLCLQFEILFSNETLVYMLKSYNYINTTGTTSGTGTVALPEHLISTSVFSGVRVTRTLVLCVMFCRSLFVLFFILAIVLSALHLDTDSYYTVSIFKLYLHVEKLKEWFTTFIACKLCYYCCISRVIRLPR
jgi:hypothetical protein